MCVRHRLLPRWASGRGVRELARNIWGVSSLYTQTLSRVVVECGGSVCVVV